MEYNVYGTVTLDINIDIEATSEEEAVEKIKKELIDYYHLNSIGEPYVEKSEIKLNTIEYED